MVNKSNFRSILTVGALALALSATACTSSTPTSGSAPGVSNSGMPTTPNSGVNDPTSKTAHQGTHNTVGPVGAGPAGSR